MTTTRGSRCRVRRLRRPAVPERRGVRGEDQEYQQRAKQGDENAVGAFRFDYARRAFAQTSLIVDPPDGRQPAYTAESFAHAMPRGTYGNGPLDWTTDFSTYERCITRGILGSTLNVIYGNGEEITQSPGYVTIGLQARSLNQSPRPGPHNSCSMISPGWPPKLVGQE